MYCTNCGNLNSNNDKFCKKCGTNLNNNVQNQVNQSNVVIPNVNQGINNNNVMIQNVNGNVDVSKKKVNKKIIFLTVGGVVLLLVVILVIVLVTSKNKNNSSGGNNIVNTNKHYDNVDKESFFFMNDDGKYALFSADGDKLSDFIYSSGDDFLYGSALVSNEADQEAIISSSGKILVDFEENTILARYGPFYEKSVFSPSYNTYLIDSNGKILYDLDNYNIVSSIGSSRYIILEDKVNNKYIILNHLNEKMLEIPLVAGVDDIEYGVTSGGVEGRYVSFFYNNNNSIFDFVSNRKIASFESDEKYCAIAFSSDESIVLLKVCNDYYGYDEDGANAKVVIGTTVYDVPDNCENVSLEDNNLICRISDEYKTLNFKEGSNILEVNLAMAYLDVNNYIKDNKSGGVDFYNNGKLVKHVACRRITSYGYHSGGVYSLTSTDEKNCKNVGVIAYYKANGEKLFEEEFIGGTNFDENGFASVMTIDEKYYGNRWYLIDKKGNKVSDLYFSIEYDDGLYGSYNDGNLYGYYDETGKEIIPCKYNNAWISTSGIRKLIILQNADYKYEIYNPEIKEIILTLDEMPTMLNDYIIVYKGDKMLYYSYSGKLMYES